MNKQTVTQLHRKLYLSDMRPQSQQAADLLKLFMANYSLYLNLKNRNEGVRAAVVMLDMREQAKTINAMIKGGEIIEGGE